MFQQLDIAPPDSILGLTEAFRKDPNPKKINLSVGVYQDANGRTPVLQCVKEAERRLLEAEASKEYLGIEGSTEFGRFVRELLFVNKPELATNGRAETLQAPGGTGALRVAADFIKRRLPHASIWCSKPTWANHPAIFQAAGVSVENYEYINDAGTGLDFDALLASLKHIPNGDVICLHACAHNPTGIDPTLEQWNAIADVLRERGVLPLVDFAYQGFGDGLADDARALDVICQACEELLVCSSYSKNFGLYAERVGALTAVTGSADATRATLSHLKIAARTNYSNPPKHGAAIVSTVLGDAHLRQQWEDELSEMRGRINGMRQSFVAMMKNKAPQHDLSFLTHQRGMFSYTGLTPLQVDELRSKYAIYIVGSGRINVAGITDGNIGRLCDAIAAVL